jgi:N-acetylglutamate synthase-like GNAT family acetyltransferase
MTVHPHTTLADVPFMLRTATPDDAPSLNALINAHREEGHLLPRQEDEIRMRASKFVVADVGGIVKACAELVPLSNRLAEVRSLVVSGDLRRHGVATRLVDELQARAKAGGFQSLLALAHDPRFFIRHGFSIVPHEWLSEKIARDCRGCALFRLCGQHAMLLPLSSARQTAAAQVRLRSAAAVA